MAADICNSGILLLEEEQAGLLLGKFTEMELNPVVYRGVDAFKQSVSGGGPHLDFVILSDKLDLSQTRDILSFLKLQNYQTIPVYCFFGRFSPQALIPLSTLINHFILDANEAEVVAKKLANLKALFKLMREKKRLNQLEKTLEEESMKLVEVNVSNVRLISETNQKSKLLEIAKQDIQNLLDNLDQGFLTIKSDGVVQEGFSKAVERLFSANPLNKPLSGLLRIQPEKIGTFTSWLEMIFSEAAAFDVMKTLGETEIMMDGKFVELDYRPIRNSRNAIERLILIATDKTQEKLFQKKAQKEEAFAQTILKIIKDRAGFLDFLEESRKLLASLGAALALSPKEIDLPGCFRMVHTLKGNSAAFDLLEVQSRAHGLEDALAEIKDDAQALSKAGFDLAPLIDGAKALDAAFQEAIEEIENAIGKFKDTLAATVILDIDDIRDFEFLLKARSGKDAVLLSGFNNLVYHQNLHKHLIRYKPIVEGIADRMGKKVEFSIESEGIKVRIEPYKPFLQSLIHAFRNAMDHGIEFPEERMEKGKAPEGHIRVIISKSGSAGQDAIRLVIEDDGQGIRLAVLQKKLIEKGLFKEAELKQMSAPEIYRTLLRSGFSTKDEVSEWSGRGVGLGAVEKEVANLGGKMDIDSKEDEYTRLIIEIPLCLQEI